MKKILFCNLDLLVKGFAGWNPEISLKNRNDFLEYISILCKDNNNVVCFISRDKNKLNSGKEHFDKRGYNKFKYKLRDDAREYVMKNSLSSFKKDYDYIIIDCNPSLDMITLNALACANKVIIFII